MFVCLLVLCCKVRLFCGSLPPACRPFSVSCLPVLMMQHTAMLPFQNEIVQDLTAANTLCIVGSGIGWTRPVTAFLHTRAVEQNGGCHSPGVLGAPKRTLEQEARRGDPTGIEPVDATKGRVSASDRQTLYKDGRCCHLTRLMLLNDLLEHQVDPDSFPGLFLFNAESVCKPEYRQAQNMQRAAGGFNHVRQHALKRTPRRTACGLLACCSPSIACGVTSRFLCLITQPTLVFFLPLVTKARTSRTHSAVSYHTPQALWLRMETANHLALSFEDDDGDAITSS